ncbi:response regulator transcription factor [Rhizobium sp. P32RR-XVIII]|uniref:winged helix-turn-helix transcriptional regulator n=1 Tax=Rhizobium sp. P32RR-XVIII TaxID=2726738 RepID=UPI0014570534|nr:response regulator transcription factor [Rhizobium sp. P32RR-XVIII]NLS07155.1 response regulator transcription factor [Rhizobium sp. P32RR-XVIII]
MPVLICTEDPELYLLLDHILSVAGFRCELADNDHDVEARVSEQGLLAVVFDGQTWHGDVVALCGFAKRAGFAVCALMGAGMTPMHLRMIKAGLDDAIVRPLAPDRLLDFLRRARKTAGAAALQIPLATPGADHIFAGEKPMRLSSIEARILRFLSEAAGTACSRQHLRSAVWPSTPGIGLRTVDVHIARLRKVLSTCEGVRIETVYGEGYALVVTGKIPVHATAVEASCQPYKG